MGDADKTYLNAVASIHMRFALVIFPDDAELDDALRNLNDVEGTLVLRIRLQEGLERRGELVQGLLTSPVSSPIWSDCTSEADLFEFGFGGVDHVGPW